MVKFRLLGAMRLKKSLDEDESHELHRLLGAMFLPTLSLAEKEDIIENEIGMELEGEGKELIGTMCNLGEGIKEDALLQGKIEGKLETRIELIIRKIQKGKNIQQIADELEETEGAIQQMYEAVLAEAPEYEVDRIYKRLFSKC